MLLGGPCPSFLAACKSGKPPEGGVPPEDLLCEGDPSPVAGALRTMGSSRSGGLELVFS